MSIPTVSTIASTIDRVHDIYLTWILPRLPSQIQPILRTFDPFPLLHSVLQTGDVVSLAAFLVCAYITLRLADYIRRSIFGWVFFFVKLGVLLLLVQMAFYVQAYGWEKALRDASWFGGVAWSMVEDLFEGQNSNARSARSGSRYTAGSWQQKPLGGGGGKRKSAWM